MSNDEKHANPQQDLPPEAELGSSREPQNWLDRWRWPLTLLGSVAVVSLTIYLIVRQSRATVQEGMKETVAAANAITERVATIAEKFKQGTITETFVASLPTIETGGSGRLELTKLESTERFRTEDQLKIWWDTVSLGTTVSEISVPVTYRYHLKLDDAWSLSVSNQTCLVTAPRIRPTIPPSIDTGQMQKSTQNGWGRFNADEQLNALEKSLTSTLVQYADDDARLALVREEARKTVASFVRNWLLREDHWRDDRFHSVIVRFIDESEEPVSLETVSLYKDE